VSNKYSAVKGMNDLFSPEIDVWHHVEEVSRERLRRFGYTEVRTPVVEDTALIVRSVGEGTDIVGKEMYTFVDKAERSLTLRPEGTAPAARAYIEHAISNREPVTRWYYLGPMFRYERMKKGRYRQFYQLGLEAYGVRESTQEVEQMDLVVQLLDGLGLKGVRLALNSLGDEACRPAYVTALVDFLKGHKAALCEDCQARLDRNPLRVLDCKNEKCQAVVAGAPDVLTFLCEPCRTHFGEVRRKLDVLGLPYQVNPRIVRGLDYYTRTVFEFLSEDPELGTASAIGAGGRYDGLVKSLGGPDVPAVGLALGLDRICLLLARNAQAYADKPVLFVATADNTAHDEALKLVSRLRAQGFHVESDARGGSLKSQMKRADKTGARYTLVLGEAEMAQRAGVLKPMAGGEPIPARLDDLAGLLKG
jgi:histidyl-tRNA synthetase